MSNIQPNALTQPIIVPNIQPNALTQPISVSNIQPNALTQPISLAPSVPPTNLIDTEHLRRQQQRPLATKVWRKVSLDRGDDLRGGGSGEVACRCLLGQLTSFAAILLLPLLYVRLHQLRDTLQQFIVTMTTVHEQYGPILSSTVHRYHDHSSPTAWPNFIINSSSLP